AGAAALVGNSSSGIIEAPSFGVPTVNVGPRQEGRTRATSVIDVRDDAAAITAAVNRALSSEFRDLARRTMNPYDTAGDGRVSERIVQRLIVALREGLATAKRFNDLDLVANLSGAR
ncbi:MAG TPA: UDP-N-acetylglucosamine 2-epimerase, partial [Rhodothermales bacterium]